MGIVEFYRKLGAPLSQNFAWGAVHPIGVVFLSVLESELHEVIGKKVAHILWPREDDQSRNPGNFNERKRHVDQIRAGEPCYCIERWEDKDGNKHQVTHYLLIGGTLYEDDKGNAWLEIVGKKQISI